MNAGSQIERVPTKRAVLSLIARCFDPLGFVSPLLWWLKFFFRMFGDWVSNGMRYYQKNCRISSKNCFKVLRGLVPGKLSGDTFKIFLGII